MRNLARGFVRGGEVRHDLQPAVTVGCFEDVPKGDEFVMDRRTRGARPFLLGLFLDAVAVDDRRRLRLFRGRSVAEGPVLLHEAGGDLRQPLVAEVREEVLVELLFHLGDVGGATLAQGDGFEFFQEFLGGVFEDASGLDASAEAMHSPELQKPVFGEVLGLP